MSRLESSYYAHMGFDPEHSRKVLGHYVQFFGGDGPVLELAPGRGEFLGLLRDAGVDAVGVDVDEGMVELACADGHKVELGDAIAYLEEVAEPGSFKGVFASHFVEHLPTEEVQRLLAGARRVLAPGGRFVAVTPNPASWPVMGHDFWRDPTHVRFYDLPLLEFLCLQSGFEIADSGINPCNVPGPRPGFSVREPAVHPRMEETLSRAAAKAGHSLRHGRLPGHDAAWARELVEAVRVLTERLQQTQEQLREVWRAHELLVQDLFQGNEIYVVGVVPE